VKGSSGVGLGIQAALLLDDGGAASARGSSAWAGPGAGRAGPGRPASGARARARAHPRVEAASGTAAQRGGVCGVSRRAWRGVQSAASLCVRCRGSRGVGSGRQQRCGRVWGRPGRCARVWAEEQGRRVGGRGVGDKPPSGAGRDGDEEKRGGVRSAEIKEKERQNVE